MAFPPKRGTFPPKKKAAPKSKRAVESSRADMRSDKQKGIREGSPRDERIDARLAGGTGQMTTASSPNTRAMGAALPPAQPQFPPRRPIGGGSGGLY